MLSIRAEDYRIYFVSVPFECKESLTGLRIPDLYLSRDVGFRRSVPNATGGGYAFTVWAESHAGELGALRTCECQGIRDGLRIPYFHRFIKRGAGQAFTVRANGQAHYFGRVPFVGDEFLA